MEKVIIQEDQNDHFNDEPRRLKLVGSDGSAMQKMIFGPYRTQFQMEQDGNDFCMDFTDEELIELVKALHGLLGEKSPLSVLEEG